MKKKIGRLIVSLMLLSALAVVSAQTPVQIGPYGNLMIGPYGNLKIGPYGNLVGLTDTQGKDVLSQIREGYVIAYRVKNVKGGSEDRLVYALGEQLTNGLTIEAKRSTNSSKVVMTLDKALEINRNLAWDAKAKALKSDIAITNAGNAEVELIGIETQVDERLVAVLLDAREAEPGRHLLEPAIWCPMIVARAGRKCLTTNDCPSCPCFPRCSRGEARGFYREPNSSKSAFEDDLLASRIPRFDGSSFSLSWTGSGLVNSTLKPGENFSVNLILSSKK